MPAPDPTVTAPPAEFAARARRITVDYPTSAAVVHALDEVDAAVGRGRLTVVAGPSGSGKSTLLRVFAGLQRVVDGAVEVDGIDVTRARAGVRRRLRRRTMGVVLQDPADNLLTYLRSVEQIELSARLRGADPAEAPSLLEAVGLADRAHSFPSELSGGEQQRVAFAAAAVGRPRLLLADEPTAELDGGAGADLVATMRRLVERGATLLVASHDTAVMDAADDLLTLRDGRVAAP